MLHFLGTALISGEFFLVVVPFLHLSFYMFLCSFHCDRILLNYDRNCYCYKIKGGTFEFSLDKDRDMWNPGFFFFCLGGLTT